MQTLDIISVNIWQMIVSLANLVLLFLIVKKILYKPVKNMLETRHNAIESDYNDAKEAKAQALSDKKAYEEKLQTASAQADDVIKSAVDAAKLREKEIIEKAKETADSIINQAHDEAELERKKVADGIKKEIVEVSSVLAEKMLEREISSGDHKHFIDSFIESIGE